MDWNAVLPMVILVGLAAAGISEASKRNKKRLDAERRWRQWRRR